jgi:signal transduction histidine kinase
LLNLMGNALRHGGGTVAIQVRRTEGTVEVTVRNEGAPIPDELLPIVFDPFQRGEERGSGLGLGLYIVREIARAHGGDVSVVSSSHQGTTFTLCLPVDRGTARR